MFQKLSFFLERAEEAANEASAAKLINVREQALRSEAAWRAMADRATETEKNRLRKAEEAAELKIAELSQVSALEREIL